MYLATFREEVVYLHFKGYSIKASFEYVKEQGVGCSLRTFERWVKDSIDFTKEECPEATKRTRPWPAEIEEGGEGGRSQGRIGQVARKPLLTDDSTGFSLAGAQADSPALMGAVVPIGPVLPKLPVLVDKAGQGLLHSETEIAKANHREAALAEARERREKGFRTPVDRALDRGEERNK